MALGQPVLALRADKMFSGPQGVVEDNRDAEIGWSLQSRPTTELVLQALLAAVWRSKPKQRIMVHTAQGPKFTSIVCSALLKVHNLEHSLSRSGNYNDNFVAESFFNLLKRELICRKFYKTRDEAPQDIFNYS